MPGLSPDRIKASVSAYQSARGTSSIIHGQNTPQITYARASRASARRTGEDSQAELFGANEPQYTTVALYRAKYGHAVPHPLTAWERATAAPAGTPGSTIRCLGNVATLAAPDGESPA